MGNKTVDTVETVDVELNLKIGNSEEKMTKLSDAGKQFKEDMTKALEVGESLPGFTQYVEASGYSFNRASDKIRRDSKKDGASSAEQTRIAEDLHFQTSVLNASFSDLSDTTKKAAELNAILKKDGGLDKVFSRSYSALVDVLNSVIKTNGNPIGKSEDYFYKAISKKLEKSSNATLNDFNQAFSDPIAKQAALRYVVATSMPQYMKTSFVNDKHFDIDKSIDGKLFENFRDSLPTAFKQLPTQRKEMFSGGSFATRLPEDARQVTDEEMKKMLKVATTNRYFADAAVQAGVMKKKDGNLLYNKNATRGQINMVGGFLMETLENALRGMPMYGITDIEDPKVWNSVYRKNNQRYRAAMEGMEVLNDFDWIAPAYYSKKEAEAVQKSRRKQFVKIDDEELNNGKIMHSPAYKAYEVARYKLGKDGELVEDSHFARQDSAQLRRIMKKKGRVVPHNSFIDDEIYLGIDERLSDPSLSEDERKAILARYAYYWERGATKTDASGNLQKYRAVSVNKHTGIRFIKEEAAQKIEEEDPGFFTGGLTEVVDGKVVPKKRFKGWKGFASAIEYGTKLDTPGEDSRELFGHELPTKEDIVVIDPENFWKDLESKGLIGKIPGLDGASFASTELVPQSFQGRMEGIKTALNAVNIPELVDLYSKATGKAYIEVAGAGKDTPITRIGSNTKMIISKADVKQYDARFGDKTNDEIRETLANDIQKYGMSVKTTFGDANTKSRWISSQLAQTLSINPEQQKMISQMFMEELHKVDTIDGAIDSVFGGDEKIKEMLRKNPTLFGSEYIQGEIKDYKVNMLQRMARGDILLPEGMNSHRNMLAPWIIDVINAAIKSADPNATLPKELEDLSLADSESVYLAGKARDMSIARMPATVGSIQPVRNVSVERGGKKDRNRAKRFKEVAKKLGLDEEGLYLSPQSSLLGLLQGADFDGDIAEVIEYVSFGKKSKEAVFKKIMGVSRAEHEKLIKQGQMTKEEAAMKQLRLSAVVGDRDAEYGFESGDDIAQYINNAATNKSLLGGPSGVSRNAFQMDRSKSFVTRSLIDAISHYDKNTTTIKTGEFLNASDEEMRVLAYGKPFSSFFQLIDKKGRDEEGNIDYEKIKNSNSYDLYRFNLPTRYSSGSVLSSLMTRYMAKEMYGNNAINEGYDWDEIFQNLVGTPETDTAVGRMQAMLQKAYKGYLNADYVALSDADLFALAEARKAAIDEVAQKYDSGEWAVPEESKGKNLRKLAEKYVNDRGGRAIWNQLNDGLYEDGLTNNAALEGLLSTATDFGFGDGLSHLSDEFTKIDQQAGVNVPGIMDALKQRQEEQAKVKAEQRKSLSQFSKEQIREKLNKHTFSFSDLQSFADNPTEWFDRIMNDKAKPYEETPFATVGSASHKVIQDYFERREQIIKGHVQNSADQYSLTPEEQDLLVNGLPAGKRGTADFSQMSLVEQFQHLLRNGYNPLQGNKGSGKYESIAGLSKDDYEGIVNKKHNNSSLQKQYDGIVEFLQGSLLDFFNPEEYEYIPEKSEKWLEFSKSKLGQKLKKNENDADEAVRVAGRADLVFRKRGAKEGDDDEFSLVDIKNYVRGFDARNLTSLISQTFLYALADDFRKAGTDDQNVASRVGEVGILFPVQGELHGAESGLGVTPESLDDIRARYANAISAIQSFSESGFEDGMIDQVRNIVLGNLFTNPDTGSPATVKQSFDEWRNKTYAEERKKLEENAASGAVIGNVLTLHEDYKDQIDQMHRISKFANKAASPYADRGNYNAWASNYSLLNETKGHINMLEQRGMFAEKNRLQLEYNNAYGGYMDALKLAAPGDLKQAYETLRKINNDEGEAKAITSAIAEYDQLTEQINRASDAALHLQTVLDEKGREKSEADSKIADLAKKIKEAEDAATALDKASDENESEDEKKERLEKRGSLIKQAEEYKTQKSKENIRSRVLGSEIDQLNETKTEADANRKLLDEETAKNKDVFRNNFLSLLDSQLKGFAVDGAANTAVKTIADDIEAYKKNIQADLDEITRIATPDKNGKQKFDWFTLDSVDYKEKSGEYKKLLESGNIDKLQNALVKEQLDQSEKWVQSNYAVLTGNDASIAVKAGLQADAFQERLAAQRDALMARIGNVPLTSDQQSRYDSIIGAMDSFDRDKYAKQVEEELQAQEDLRKQREQLRSDRLIREANKSQKDPFGKKGKGIFGQIETQRQAAVDRQRDYELQLQEEVNRLKSDLGKTTEGTEEYDNLSESLEQAEKSLEGARDAAQQLEGPFGSAAVAGNMLAQSAINIAAKFGRQLFQKATQEAKQFVVQWDTTMTEIRMVTGKTQSEISTLSEELMQTAIKMKVDPTAVGEAAVDLYRQGLSDEEISVRMEDVLKFSKVAGITVEQASKMLTTAMSNGLVTSTQEAMDAMVALGDSAATTAEDISKGMQKSAAAAKEAGVSYEQLLTMLTIITSKTQLSGTNAGTTLQTLFNRMYRVTSGQDIYDENGNRIAATTTSNALKNVGVNMFDNNGNYRGAYDILMDLAKGWEGYSDTDRNLILNTLGAGRQSSNVATLLQGLGEDNGELADKYMGLASGSEGITDEKYVAYLESLNAALQNVKTAFDAFIESLSTTGVATGFLDFIANIIQGLTSASNATGGLTSALLILVPVITAVGVAIASATGKLAIAGTALNINPIFAAVTAFTLLATAIGGVVSAFSSMNQKEDPFETLTQRYSEIGDKKTESLNSIDHLEQLAKKENRTTAETNELNDGLAKLNVTLGRTGSGANDAAFGVDDFTDSVDEARDSVNALAEAEALLTAKGLVADVVSGTEEKMQIEQTRDKDLFGQDVRTVHEQVFDTWKKGFVKNKNGQIDPDIFGDVKYKNGMTLSHKSVTPADVARWYITDSFANYILSLTEVEELLSAYNLSSLVTDADSLITFLSNKGSFNEKYTKGHYGDSTLTNEDIFNKTGGDPELVVYAAQEAFLQKISGWYSNYLNGNQTRSQNLDTLQQDAYDFIYGLVQTDSDLSAADALLFSALYSENMRKQYEGIPELNDVFSQYGLDTQLFLQRVTSDNGTINTDFIREYIAQNKKDYIVDLLSGGQDEGLSYDQAVENAIGSYAHASVGYTYGDGKSVFLSKEDAASAMARAYGNDYFNAWVAQSNLDPSVDAWSAFVQYFVDDLNAIKEAPAYVYEGAAYTRAQIEEALSQYIHRASEDEAVYEDSAIGRSEKAFKAITSSKTSYQTTNSSKFEADALYEAIVSNGISSWQDLFDAIAANKLPTLENVVNSNPGTVGATLSKFVDFDSETGELKIKNDATNADLMMLLSQIASVSENYTAAGTMSDLELGAQVKDTWTRFKNSSALPNLATDNVKKIVGDNVFAELQSIDNELTRATAEDLMAENPTWTQEMAQEEAKQLVSEGKVSPIYANKKKQVLETGGYTKYIDMLTGNSSYGIDGLTTVQQNELQQDLLSRVMSGNTSVLSESMRSTYAGGNATLSSLADIAYGLESNGLSVADLSPDAEGYEEAKKIIEEMGYSIEDVQGKIKSLSKELSSAGVRAAKKYGDQTDDVADAMDSFGTTAKKNTEYVKSLNSEIASSMNRQYYRDQWRAGKRDNDTLSAISEMTGFDVNTLKLKAYEDEVTEFLDTIESLDIQDVQNKLTALGESMNIPTPDINMEGADLSGLVAQAASTGDAAAAIVLDLVNYLVSIGAEVEYQVQGTGDSAKIVPVIKKMPGRKSGKSGGGGGGGGKSAGKKLIEEQDHETTLREHIIKMIQYEETRYQNADELTNYGIMLQHEIDEEERQTKVIEKNIEALKNQLAQTSKGSDDWYELREAILKAEESLSEMNNTIDENKKKLKENEQAILKLHTDLEQEVKGEIETRIQEERDMLDGQVSMEQTILDAIKNRYEKEWELMQKDIDKKKKALQEEMDLIDERLQRRKDAEDEAEKYEELAEYKRQLALISTDSTRTKDQAALKEKIADLEKELAWDKAEEEADLQKEGLQDQIDAYDQYTEDYQEYLDDLLENANNFADEVNSVMQMSHEDMIAWLQKNVEEYTNSLESSQKQMTQGWDDTFKQMKGIIDTFWAEIAQTLSSKYNFLAYMHNSSAYQNASEDEKKQMDYNWGTMYDSWISAKKESEDAKNYKHEDETLNGNGGNSGDKKDTLRFGYKASYNGEPKQSRKDYLTTTEAKNAGKQWVQNKGNADLAFFKTQPDTPVMRQEKAKVQAQIDAAKNNVTAYKQGGLVDYTGPAWVDGTKSQPEAFLSADDTQMIRTLIDGWKYVAMQPTVTNVDGLLGRSSSNTIGQVNVTLNEAQFNTDEDYELVAQKVGEAFTKELAKTGFKTASFAF